MKVLRQVMLQVASGLILYGVVWMLENSELGQQRLVGIVEALAAAGRPLASPLVVAAMVIVVLAIVSFAAAKWGPLPKSAGIDRADATFALHGLGRFLLCCASVSLAAAAGFFLMKGNAGWGIALLGATAFTGGSWAWRSVRRLRRFLSGGF